MTKWVSWLLRLSPIAAWSLFGCGEPDALYVVPPSEATLIDGAGAEYLAHEVIAELTPGHDPLAFDAAVAALGGRIVDADSPLSQEFGFQRILLPESLTADQAISELSRQKVVRGAARNYLVQVGRTPNDPRYGELWGLAQIGAPAAWDRTTGDRAMVVAVVDTGIDPNHPDLGPNLWINPREIAGNGLDDDNNGYVDDVSGWDFYNNDSGPADDNGHGSHVSGTIGASGDDGQGVAGLNWRVQLMGLKVLGANGSGSLWSAAQAILYASKAGAKVVNASFGCQGCNVSYMAQAIQTLGDGGGLFVAAAGNNGSNNDGLPFYPACHTEGAVISVAATTPADALASFSNYGATCVDLAAPGTSILSTIPGNRYAAFDGTSMAAPHVTGALALFWSAHPSATAAEVKARLYATVAARSTLAGKVATGGRLDVAALIQTDVAPPAAPTGLSVEAGPRRSANLSWTGSSDTDLALYRIAFGTAPGQPTRQQDVAAPGTRASITGLTHGLTYYFSVRAMDTAGNLSSPTPEVALAIVDDLAPPSVLDLSAESLPGVVLSGQVVVASGEYSEDYRAENAADGSPDTSWNSPARAVAQEELLVIQLDQPSEIERVDLLPSRVHAEFFPVDFDLEVSRDGSQWTPVAGQRGAVVPTGWANLNFPAVFASHVRLRVLRSYQHPSGLYYAGLAEVAVRAKSMAPDALLLHFTAPGDDPGAGTAARYDLRRALSPITVSNFAAATSVPGPTPAASGIPIEHLVTGLSPETTYYFALKAYDAAGNSSGLSNVASASTLIVPPAAVTDLTIAAATDHTVTLTFTAPGGDGAIGQAASYELRYSPLPLHAANFAGANLVPNLGPPGPAGTRESVTVNGLDADRLLYFGVMAVDAAGNRGGLSNVVAVATTNGPDLLPPAQVTDLVAYPSLAQRRLSPTVVGASSARPSGEATRLLDQDPASAWRSSDGAELAPEWVSFDLGAVEPVARLRLRASTVGWQASEYPRDLKVELSADGNNWTQVIAPVGLTGAAGTWDEWAAPVTYARYLKLSVLRRGLGACAAGASSCLRAVALGELEVYGLTPALEADLAFTAPGDDGYLGTAQSYRLRTSAEPIDSGTWANATPLSLPAPLPGGMLELHTLPPLTAESRQYFALTAVDEAGNEGALSNLASVVTPGIPPAPITDLSATVLGPTSITLSFTATGDDGLVGQAAAYDLRYAHSTLTVDTWGAATAVLGLAPPQPSRTVETRTITGLQPDTAYALALKVIDDLGQASLLSNVLYVRTLDGTAPARVTDLTAEVAPAAASRPAGALLASASGAFSFETAPDNLLDGDDGTVWLSPARATPTEEQIELSLPTGTQLARVRLRAAPAYTDLFPTDFRVEIERTAGGPWSTLLEVHGFATTGGWEEWAVGAVQAVAARLVITGTNTWVGSYYAALAEIDLQATNPDGSAVRLAFTAPGDDDTQGTAARYDLRRSSAPLTDANFGNGQVVSGVPTPSAGGSLERITVSGLPPASTQCFALKAQDEANNRSAASNSPCVLLPAIPPSVIADLAVSQLGSTSVTLSWSAPGGMGTSGTASGYDLRLSTSRITFDNWDQATPILGIPTPAAPGTRQSHTVSGLLGQTRYYFGLKANNTAGQVSALSNVVEVITLDNVAPTEVTDLSAATDPSGTGRLLLAWTAPGDGETGTLASYELRASRAPITSANFSQGRLLSTPAPRAPGQRENVTVSGLDPEALWYLALKTKDAANNLSDLSNVASASTRDEAPARVTDLAVQGGAGQTSVTLSFTAPGDDGALGTATSYDLRYSTNYISAIGFDSAPAVPNPPAPLPGGTSQTVVVSGLVSGTTYYFAMKASDERGNVSAMSNWVSTQTVDASPPGAVTDLAAVTGNAAGRVSLTWTAPGDDGNAGLAQAYELRWSTAPITAGNFAAATVAGNPPLPQPGGSPQSFVVFGLPNEAALHFALRARDDAGNWSAVSNSAAARTPDVAPGRITTLAQTARTGTSLTVSWTATGDDGASGQATTQELRWSTQPITELNFAAAVLAPLPAPQPAGTLEQRTISGLSPDTTYYLALIATDERGNSSPLSNVVTAATADTQAPASISDLVGSTASIQGAVNLAFTAPGDDGVQGTATRYDLRWSTSPIGSGNFAAATPVTAPTPRSAGARESLQVGGLPGEATLHFAVRAIDEANNEGALAPSVAVATRPVPPSRITNLSATPGSRSVTLSWTAPGDDGTTGRATRYELRWATAALTAGNFDSGTLVSGVPAPLTAGGSESFVVTGLAEATTYYFGIVAIDDVGATSPLSNVPSAVTPDQTAPSAPGNLVVVAPPSSAAPLPLSNPLASSELGPTWRPSAVIDGNLATSWSSASRATPTSETLTVDLGSPTKIDRIRLAPDAVYPALFPRAFSLEVSSDGSTFTSVAQESEFSVSEPGWLEWGFEARMARWVRLVTSQSGASYGAHYVIVAELEVVAAAPTTGRAQLAWIAPGDDGNSGAASTYEIYRGAAPFTAATLSAATRITGAPTPANAGALQTITVDGLQGERSYWWAIRAVDDEGNVGALSPVVTAMSNPVAPAAIGDLAGVAQGMSSVQLSFSAPGDDGRTGNATRYEVRYSSATLTSRNWVLANVAPQNLVPRAPNGRETVTITGLQPATLYRFLVLSYDEANTPSALSNVALVRTAEAPDAVGPAGVADLSAQVPSSSGQRLAASAAQWSGEQAPNFVGRMIADQDRTSAWSVVAGNATNPAFIRVDLGSAALVDRVQLWPAPGFAALFPVDFEVRVSPNGLTWTVVHSATNHHATEGVPLALNFSPAEVRFVELAISRLASYGNGLYYAVVAELEPFEAATVPGSALITWTAPGDDGALGTATTYHLFHSGCPFDAASATAAPTEAPQAAGTPERALLRGIPSGLRCFRLTTLDEAGNEAPASNVATVNVSP